MPVCFFQFFLDFFCLYVTLTQGIKAVCQRKMILILSLKVVPHQLLFLFLFLTSLERNDHCLQYESSQTLRSTTLDLLLRYEHCMTTTRLGEGVTPGAMLKSYTVYLNHPWLYTNPHFDKGAKYKHCIVWSLRMRLEIIFTFPVGNIKYQIRWIWYCNHILEKCSSTGLQIVW